MKIDFAINLLINENTEMKEPQTDYKINETLSIPDWHIKELEERLAKFERGETVTKSWETVKKEIKAKYGF